MTLNQKDKDDFLKTATYAAKEASKVILRSNQKIVKTYKAKTDLVTSTDHESERVIIDIIRSKHPGHSILAEESGNLKKHSDYNWIIDPLDGTTNFLHGIPHFAISIAVLENKKLIAAGILDPLKDEFFFAEHGKGAYLNDRRIRVSGRKQVETALFATGIPFMGKITAEKEIIFINQLNHIMPRCSGIRRFGSAALDLAWVAAGRYDGFWEHGLKLWNIAAGTLIVREAGGFVSDFSSRDTVLQNGNIVAANAGLHIPLLKMLKEGEKALN